MLILTIVLSQCLMLSSAIALTQHLDIIIKPASECRVPNDRSTLRMRSLVLKMSNNSLGMVAKSRVISGEYFITYRLMRTFCYITENKNTLAFQLTSVEDGGPFPTLALTMLSHSRADTMLARRG